MMMTHGFGILFGAGCEVGQKSDRRRSASASRLNGTLPTMNKTAVASFDLSEHGLNVSEIHHNLPPSSLYEHAIRFEKDATIAENGALVAYSGVKTGRSPKDKRVVENPASKKDIWWGTVNIPCDQRTFQINRQRALDYLNTRERLYCFDGFADGIRNIASKSVSSALARFTRSSCIRCSFVRHVMNSPASVRPTL
jgi:ATP-dependent phosphoenolpyruvate carboxykinase